MSFWRLRPFHVQEISLLEFTNVPLNIHLFIYGYERFISHTFIYWWPRTLYVKALSFLKVTNVSRHLPLFLDGYGHSGLKPFFSWKWQVFTVKNLDSLTVKNVSHKNPDLTNSTFLQNHSLPILFPYLLLTYNNGEIFTLHHCPRIWPEGENWIN